MSLIVLQPYSDWMLETRGEKKSMLKKIIKYTMTRDEIQAQINIIKEHRLENFCEGLVEKLEQEKLKYFTVEYIQEKSFVAGYKEGKYNLVDELCKLLTEKQLLKIEHCTKVDREEDYDISELFKDYLKTI